MGYHLTILRSSQHGQIPIPLDEATVAARALGWECDGSQPAFWRHTDQGTCTLWYQDGELWVKSPELWEIAHLLVLANNLRARVRGDEFETYESTDKTFLHPDDRQLRKEAEVQSKALLSQSMREQKLIRNVIVGFFVTLAVIGYFIGKWFEKQ
jgi:hypothetical protein